MEMWYVDIMEYYSAVKKIEIIKFTGKWMVWETVILCEVINTQKDKCHMLYVVCRCYI